jgi:hypothetical protein
MRYIVKPTASFPKTDPIHANPYAKAWAVYDTFDGYLNNTYATKAEAEEKAAEWEEDEEG